MKKISGLNQELIGQYLGNAIGIVVVGIIFLALVFFQFKLFTASALAGAIWMFLFVGLVGLVQPWGIIISLRKDYLRKKFQLAEEDLKEVPASKSLNPWYLPLLYCFPFSLLVGMVFGAGIYFSSRKIPVLWLALASFFLAILLTQASLPTILKKDLARWKRLKEEPAKEKNFSGYFFWEYLIFWLPVQAVINLALGAGIYFHQFPGKSALELNALANDLAITALVVLLILFWLGKNQLQADLLSGRIEQGPEVRLKTRTKVILFFILAGVVWIGVMGTGSALDLSQVSIKSASLLKTICAVICSGLGLYFALMEVKIPLESIPKT